MTTVAVVGLGRMGSAMARALAASGDGGDLVLHNRTPERARALAEELGARVAETPAAAAAEADVVISMLADGAAVASVWDGPDGLLAGARSGAVLVDMSTVPPDTLLPYADRAGAAGAGLLDAPVSGSVALAESGSLTIMAGGDGGALERARPVLDRLSQKVFHMGPLGSGHAMKLAVNGVIFALNNAVSEALVLAERAGIEREAAYEVLASGAAGAPFVGYKREAFLEPDTAPVGFSLELAGKDLDLITAFADALGVPMPLATVSREVLASGAAGAPFVGYKREAFLEPDTAPVGFSLELAGKDLDLITAFADALGVPVPLATVSREVIGESASAVGADRDFSAVAVHLRDRAHAGEGSTAD